MKKLVMAILILALFCSFSATAEIQFPLEETETLTVVALLQIDSTDFNTMRYWQDIEEQTNVHVEFTMYEAANVGERLATMLASGDYPDICFVGLGDADTYKYGHIGEILPLNDLIDQYAPNWKAAMEQYPDIRNSITTADGNIYALPYVRKDPNNYGIRDAMLINTTWLKNLNLEMPTTPDELIDVLTAFKEQDPNGNGEADEIPFTALLWNYSKALMDVFGWFGNATGSSSLNWYIAVEDGKVYLPVADESFKEAVSFLHTLYEKGLLDSNVATQDPSMLNAKCMTNPLIVGMTPAYHGGGEFGLDVVKENYDALLPLNTGHESFVRFQQNAIERNRAVIFKTCKNPELAIKWLDNLASTENSFLSFYGYEGTHITKKDDGTYDAIDANYSTRALEVPVNNTGAFLITEEIASRVNKTGTDALRKKFVDAYAPYRIDSAKVYPNLVLQPEQSEGLVDAGLSEWQDYCYTNLAKWIVEGGIDDEWDDYVAQITSMAAPSLAIYQEALDAYYGG